MTHGKVKVSGLAHWMSCANDERCLAAIFHNPSVSFADTTPGLAAQVLHRGGNGKALVKTPMAEVAMKPPLRGVALQLLGWCHGVAVTEGLSKSKNTDTQNGIGVLY